jgi:fibronectin-binding autotransporter adhesin
MNAPRRSCPLRVEQLEDRTVPTIITVSTASDLVGHSGTSLRDAIVRANADAPAGISDTIVFASSLAGATITLAQGQLELSGHAAGGGTITIDGSSLASPLTISGNNTSRVFRVDSGVPAILNDLVIAGGNSSGSPDSVHGGGIDNSGNLILNGDVIENNNASFSGTSAGVGGIPNVGGGGGIYNIGTLTLTGDTVENNQATVGTGTSSVPEGDRKSVV